MDLRHLVTFQAVVARGGFLKAAQALRCAQSTVTLHVHQLEADLSVALFRREGKRAALTEAGRLVAEHAGQVLERVEALKAAVADLAGGEGGQVRVGVIEPTASLRLTALLARFCAARPKVRLVLEVGGTRTVSGLVASGELDVAICSPPAPRLGLTFEPLFTEALGLLAPAGHRLARRRRLAAADLAGERLLVTDAHCAYREAIERAFQARGAMPASGVEIGSLLALRQAVERGLGVAIVPVAMATPPPPGTVLRPIGGLDLALPVGLVHRADAGHPGPALAAFLAALREALAAPAAGSRRAWDVSAKPPGEPTSRSPAGGRRPPGAGAPRRAARPSSSRS